MLTGRMRSHVEQDDALRCALHPAAFQAFRALRAAGMTEGFDIQPFSAFRDFEAQVSIWNRKFRGERTLYAADGSVLDRALLSDDEAIDAILSWSALPGASRHHWGSDVDVYDGARVESRHDVELLPHESAPGGAFHALHRWLDEALPRFGFFRPYDVFRGGMNAEPWHLSFADVSVPALKALTPAVIRRALADAKVEGHALVEARLEEVHARYITNVSSPL